MWLLNRLRVVVLILVGVTLPFESRGFGFEPFGLRILSLNKIMAAVLVVFVALQWAMTRRRAPEDSKTVWMLFFAVSVGVSAVQAYATDVVPLAIFDAAMTSYTLVLFYFVLNYTLVARRDLDLLIGSFIVGCVLAAGSGLLGFSENIQTTRYGERLAGEGGNANLLTFNLLIAIPMAGSFFFTSQRRWVRASVPWLVLTMTSGVVLSLTRTAYVAFPAMLLYFGYRFRGGTLLKYAIPVALLFLLPVMFAPENVGQRFQEFVAAEGIEDLDKSAQSRFRMLPNAVEAAASNPVTGVGLSGYRTWALRHGYRAIAVHNAYLQVLAEQGLLGFVPFMALIVLSWRQSARAGSLVRRNASGDAELRLLGMRALFLQVAFVGPLVMGLAQPSNRHKGLWLLFSLSTVVLTLVRRRALELAPAPTRTLQQWGAPVGAARGAPAVEGRRP